MINFLTNNWVNIYSLPLGGDKQYTHFHKTCYVCSACWVAQEAVEPSHLSLEARAADWAPPAAEPDQAPRECPQIFCLWAEPCSSSSMLWIL